MNGFKRRDRKLSCPGCDKRKQQIAKAVKALALKLQPKKGK